jgi:hypothetical protein
VPRKIIVDNAKQFDCHIFKDFCHQMGVEAAFASVYHPQSNGAVEKANTLIFLAIKKILEDQPKGKWAEELPRAVWSHNTSICRVTKFIPFKLLYGEELLCHPVLRSKPNAHRMYARIKLSYIRLECEYRNPMSLLYNLYYTRYCLYMEDYIDSLIEQQRNNPTP